MTHRRSASLLLTLLAALTLLTVTAPAASAHAALLSTMPNDAEILQGSPSEVTLTFGEPVGIALGALRVLSPDGDRVDGGAPSRTDGGKVVHLPVKPGLAEGSYLVVWRVVSADSHPVAGAFTFSVGKPSVEAKELLGRGNLTSLASAPRAPGLALGVSRFLGFAALMVLLGGSVFFLLLWPAGITRLRGLLVAATLVEGVAAGLALALQGPYAAGKGLSSTFDRELLSSVLDSQYGQATAWRGALCVVLLLVLLVVRRRPRVVAGIGVGLGLACAATWSRAGHAGVGEWQPITFLSDLTHLLAVSVWVGGLLILVVGMRGRWTEPHSARILPGWSRLASVAVVVLIASGTFASIREVGELGALFSTRYGGLLISKIALVGLMLLFALIGRAVVRQHHSKSTARVDSEPHTQPTEDHLAALRRSTAIEAVLAAVVLAVTAILVNTTPAKSAFAPPYIGRSKAGPLTVQVDIYPARKGLNGLHIYTVGAGGRTVDVAEVTGNITRGDGEKITVQPRHKSLGHYEDLSLVLPATGTWTIELQIRTNDLDSYPTKQVFVVQ